MKIITSQTAHRITPNSTTVIFEFLTGDPDLSSAVTEITGRYPENGFAYNEKSKELAYVIDGEGAIATPSKKTPIRTGDVVHINQNEHFAWEGNLTLFMATAPAFDPTQHEITEE